NSADDIDIVQNEGLVRGVLQKKVGSLFQPAASIQQRLLARDRNPHAEVVVGFQVFHNHVGEVMHVDDHLANSKVIQTRERDLQQGAAADFHQRLGTTVGKRPQARAQTGGQNHGFHLPRFSRDRKSVV